MIDKYDHHSSFSQPQVNANQCSFQTAVHICCLSFTNHVRLGLEGNAARHHHFCWQESVVLRLLHSALLVSLLCAQRVFVLAAGEADRGQREGQEEEDAQRGQHSQSP